MTLTRGRLVLVGVGAVALGGLWLALGSRTPTPEEQVRRTIQDMADAAERRSVGEVMEGVSERFSGPEGSGRDELRALLTAQILKGQLVKVFVRELEVSIDGPTEASVRAQLFLARAGGVNLEELAKAQGSSYGIEGKLVREGSQWRFVWAKHHRVD